MFIIVLFLLIKTDFKFNLFLLNIDIMKYYKT